MKLTEAFSLYHEEVISYKNQSGKTLETHECAQKQFLSIWGDIQVCDLEFSHLLKFKTALEQGGRSQNTIRLYIIRLRNVIRHLNVKGFECLSYEEILVPKKIETAPRIATVEEVQLMIESTGNKRNKALIATLYASGARVSEICSLNISDLREDRFTVYGKGGKHRLCFLDDRSHKLINDYLLTRTDNNPALFLNQNGGRMTPLKVQDVFKYVRKAAKINRPITPHTLRHTYATNLLKNGCQLYYLSQLLGHKSVETTAQYLHLENPDLQKVYRECHTI